MSKKNDWPEHQGCFMDVGPEGVKHRHGVVRFDDEKPSTGEVVYEANGVGYSKTYADKWASIFGPKAEA